MTSGVLDERTSGPRVGLSVLVRQVRWEAAGVVSVELCAPDGMELPPWRPGAHVEVTLPTGIVRQYSLCGPPGERSRYRIGVLRERGSRGGSEYVHAFLRPGQTVRIRGPVDNFRFGRGTSYLFIAGGIGITPILPMVHQAAAWGVPWRLVYGGRAAASMAFLDELAGYGERVRLYPRDKVGPIPLDEWLGRPRDEVDVYACGPGPLLAAVDQAAARWRPGAVRMERFKARAKPPRENAEVTVVCARAGRTVTVPADRSILGALEDEGLPVAGSCREGLCGTCETAVLDGVPDHRDDILSAGDRAAGDRMFICVSRATGSRLVLDI